ncbi:MAG: helicase-related protein, partial [Bacilli bacterium]
IDDIIGEINKRREDNERVLITTLTIRMSEELTNYLKEMNIKVAYLHSEIKTLERLKIIQDLRLGVYDCVVGINLLREGIDIPEVSLICILDADKQGFLRSARSLIQTIGRCARNSNGHVIMYADKISPAMEEAISETDRRRKIQAEYNKVNGITPTTIVKAIKEIVSNDIANKNPEKMKKRDRQKLIVQIEEEMNEAARAMDFERAMELRDVLFELKGI